MGDFLQAAVQRSVTGSHDSDAFGLQTVVRVVVLSWPQWQWGGEFQFWAMIMNTHKQTGRDQMLTCGVTPLRGPGYMTREVSRDVQLEPGASKDYCAPGPWA